MAARDDASGDLRESDGAANARSSDQSGGLLKGWMIAGLAVWTMMVIAALVVTNIWPSARICEDTTVTTPQSMQKKVAENGTTPPTTTTTTSSRSVELTQSCSGMTVAQAALLLVPGFFFLLPALSSIDFVGVAKLTFREVNRKLDAQQDAIASVENSVNNLRSSLRMVSVVNNYGTLGSIAQEGAQQMKLGDLLPADAILEDDDEG